MTGRTMWRKNERKKLTVIYQDGGVSARGSGMGSDGSQRAMRKRRVSAHGRPPDGDLDNEERPNAALPQLGDVGKHVAAMAVDKGWAVTCVGPKDYRSVLSDTASVTKPQLHEQDERHVTSVAVDLSDPGDPGFDAALAGADAVVVAAACRQPGWKLPHLKHRYSASVARAVVRVAGQRGDGGRGLRVVAVSTPGIGDSAPARIGNRLVSAIFQLMLDYVIPEATADMREMEETLATSNLDYLVVRPAGVTPEKRPSNAEVRWATATAKEQREGAWVGLEIAKEDAAAFVLGEALEPTRHRTGVVVGGPV